MVSRYVDDELDEDDLDDLYDHAVKQAKQMKRENETKGFSARVEKFKDGRDEIYLYRNNERVPYRVAETILTQAEIKKLRQGARTLVDRKVPRNSGSIITKARWTTESKLVTKKR